MEEEKRRLRKSIYIPVGLSLLLWLVKAIEYALSLDFGQWGIFPRSLSGSVGIFLSGFIHGDIFHLMSNTIPLVLLGATVLYFYDKLGVRIIFFLYLLTGFVVWLLARPAYHIGASGLIYGMLSFLFASGLIRRDRQSLTISLVILLLYGGTMFTGLFPQHPHVSWESHLTGFVFGIILAVYYRKSKIIASTQRQANSAQHIDIQGEDPLPKTTSWTTINESANTTFTYYYLEKSNK